MVRQLIYSFAFYRVEIIYRRLRILRDFSFSRLDHVHNVTMHNVSLQILDLSCNQISSMDGLQGHMFLECINLAENDVGTTISYMFDIFYLLQIIDLKEITYVVDLRMLRVLNLKHNPVEVVIQC